MFKRILLTTALSVSIGFSHAATVTMTEYLVAPDVCMQASKFVAEGNPKSIKDEDKATALELAKTYYTLLNSLKALIEPTVKRRGFDTTRIGTLSPWFKDIKALDDTIVLRTKGGDIDGYSARRKLRDKMLKKIDSLLQKYQDFMTSGCSKYDSSMFKDIDNTLSTLDRDFRLLVKDDITKLLKESVGFSDDVEPEIARLLKYPIENQKKIEDILTEAIHHKIDFLKIISVYNHPLSITEYLCVSTIMQELPAIIGLYRDVLKPAQHGSGFDKYASSKLERVNSRYNMLHVSCLSSHLMGIVIYQKKKEELDRVLQNYKNITSKYGKISQLQLEGRIDKSGHVQLTIEERLTINQALDDINAMQKQFEDLTANLTDWDIIESIVSDTNPMPAYDGEDIYKLMLGCDAFFDRLIRISTYERNDRIRYARTEVEWIFKRMYPLKDNAWAKRIEAALVSISDSDEKKREILSSIEKKSANLIKQYRDVEDRLKNRSFGMSAARNLLKNFKNEALKLCEMLEQL